MSNVRNTVTTAAGTLPYGAQTHVDRVVTALEARDAEIADQLRTAATRLSADTAAVERVLEEVGLVTPAPVATTTSNGEGGVDVADLLRRVSDLETLAQRHLGSRR